MGKIENRKRSAGSGGTGGAGVSATNQLLINTTEPEVAGKQYQSIANANAYATANPLQQFQTLIVGEIIEDVQLIINNTITGLDNIKSYINGTVSMATFLGDFYGSIISNCRIKRFEGTPGGLSIPQNCFIEDIGNLEGAMGYIHVNTDIVDGDFTTIAPTPIGIIMFGGSYQSVSGNSYVKFNGDVTMNEMSSLGDSTVMDCKDIDGRLQFNHCRLGLADLMYPDDNGATVDGKDTIINTSRLLSVDTITGDGNGLITVVTLYPHQMHDGEKIRSSGRDDSDFNISSAVVTYIDDYTFTFGVLGTPSGTTSNGYIQRQNRVTYIANPSADWQFINSYMPGRFNFTGGDLLTLNLLSNNYISVTAPATRTNDGITIDIRNMSSITSTRLQGVLEELYALISTPPSNPSVIYRYTGNGNGRDYLDNLYDFASLTEPVKVIVKTSPGNNGIYFSSGAVFGGLDNIEIEFMQPSIIYFQNDTTVTSRFRNIKGDVLIANQNNNVVPLQNSGKNRCNCEGDVRFQSISVPFFDTTSSAYGSLELTGDWSSLNGGALNFNLSPYVLDSDNKFEIRRGYVEDNTFGGGNYGNNVVLTHTLQSAYQDEWQFVGFKHAPVAGTYALVWNGNTFAEIPFDSDAATLEAALRTIPALSQVVVTGDYIGGFTIIMIGLNSTMRGILMTSTSTGLIDGNGNPCVINQNISKTGAFAQSLLTSAPLPTGGTYTLQYQNNTSNPIQWNAIASDIEIEVRSITGNANMSVSGDLTSSGGATIVWNELYADPSTLTPVSSLLCTASTLTIAPLTANPRISTTQSARNGSILIGKGIYNENIRRTFTTVAGGITTNQKQTDDVALIRDANSTYALQDLDDGHQVSVLCLSGPSFITALTNIFGAGINTNNFKIYEGESIVLVKAGTNWRVVSFNSVIQEGASSPYSVMPPRFIGELYRLTDGSLFMGIDTSTDTGRIQIVTSIPTP